MDTNEHAVRVVLADDHEVVRHGIRQYLVAAGIDVVGEAADGQRALNLIESLQPDVAVLDIQMPNLSGIEVARQVRGQGWPVGLLILTAYDDEPFIATALEAGVNGFVLKTSDLEEIAAAVHAVHEGKSVLDPNIVPKLMNAIASKREPDTYYEPLTDRETEVLKLAAQGLTNKAIAYSLSISDRTVQGHLRRIYEKLNVANRTEAVVRASQLNLLELPSRDETNRA
jgi:DNA-binding NarL/FixJ family response regulator